MRAIQIDRHGGPEVLTVRELDEPTAADGEVLIRTVASSINPVDWKTRAWDRGPAFPMTLGWDLAGVVVESTVPPLRTGDRVVAMSGQLSSGRGTWAEVVALPAGIVTTAPRTVSLAEAATLPLTSLTAAQALARLQLTPESRVLVTGAAGGVGGSFIQQARRTGARIDGLVSRPAHVEAAHALGAQFVTHERSELPAGVYDAVFDTAGIDPRHAMAQGAKYLSITDDPLPDIPGAAKVQIREDGRGLAALVRLVDAGALTLRAAHYFPLQQVRAASRRVEAGGLLGKVVLVF